MTRDKSELSECQKCMISKIGTHYGKCYQESCETYQKIMRDTKNIRFVDNG
jgi:hypothetical protein